MPAASLPPPAPPALRVIVAAPPTEPGTDALLEAALAQAGAGAAVSVLFSEAGLDALLGDWPARLHAAGVHTSLCARSARARRLDPAALPRTVLWSSLTSLLSEAGPAARLWTVVA